MELTVNNLAELVLYPELERFASMLRRVGWPEGQARELTAMAADEWAKAPGHRASTT